MCLPWQVDLKYVKNRLNFPVFNWSKLKVLPGAKKLPNENQQNWFDIACKEQG